MCQQEKKNSESDLDPNIQEGRCSFDKLAIGLYPLEVRKLRQIRTA